MSSISFLAVEEERQESRMRLYLLLFIQLIYKHKIENSEPVFKMETGAKIIENMYVCP